ncbi:MAG TPA: hypothetical protein VEG65_03105 [Candidatus Bathyarchaeia archaeon]|nr:hypothetical protein [Candidatus Bathyarchaeia archaeon]
MNRKYVAALVAITLFLVVLRVGYSLAVWGGSVDPDPWKLIGDTNKYVVAGHYSPSATQTMYYGAYSVGLEALLAALSIFTGIDLVVLAQYFLQIATPIVMVAVVYLITSRSGRLMSWAIPVMILLIGVFEGITHQQSRMIEENLGFILFCGALLFLYLYYTGRSSRGYVSAMLTAILLVTIFTHHLSFLVVAILAMPFLVSSLRWAAPAYIGAMFVPWWAYYPLLNGYSGVYVGIFFYTAIGLVSLYAVAAIFYAWRSKTRSTSASRLLARLQARLAATDYRPTVAALTVGLGAGAIAYCLATGLQSGYLPFFVPLAPLVVYAGAQAAADRQEASQIDRAYVRYLVLSFLLLAAVTALGFVTQFTAGSASTLPAYLGSIQGLASLDLGSRLTTWLALVYGIVATAGLILVSSGAPINKRWLTPSVTAILVALALLNVTVLAVNYNASFAITAPADTRVTSAAVWTVGKDPDNVTMTDYKDEMLFWYYTGALVLHPPDSERANYTVLDYIYPGYLQQWNGSGHTGINYLFLTAAPPKYYYEHLLNGQWKLSPQNSTQWSERIAAIDNSGSGIDKVYTNGYASYYKVVGV